MKIHFLKTFTALVISSALLYSFTFLPDRTNFSGNWTLDASKSDLGQFADYATHTIKTDQAADSITISRTAPSFNGDDNTSVETLTFDGKQCNTKLYGESTKTATLKWADDGQSFSETYKLNLDFNGQQMEINGTEKWSLADGGKTLVIENSSSSSFGDISTKAVYTKQ